MRNTVGTRTTGECFHSFFEFSQTATQTECLYNSIETENMFSISFRKHGGEKGKQIIMLALIFKM